MSWDSLGAVRPTPYGRSIIVGGPGLKDCDYYLSYGEAILIRLFETYTFGVHSNIIIQRVTNL